jgi:glutamate N-acetyltransferase/amino-acid N-acetyltransferase
MFKEIFPAAGIWIEETQGQDATLDEIRFQLSSGQTVSVMPDLRYQPEGIKSSALYAGVSDTEKLDLTLIVLDKMGLGKAVYTTSLTASEAVRFDRKNTAHGQIQALCVLSKNANVFTPTAMKDLYLLADEIAVQTGIPVQNQLISCTGVIGVPLPINTIVKAIPKAAAALQYKQLELSAEAILTTDLGVKMASIQMGDVIISGFVKGAGMIEPNMATMLAYFFTNVKMSDQQLDVILKRAASKTFNKISVDSDTSTSDTLALISTLEVSLTTDAAFDDFEKALTALFYKLSRDIIAQAEGAKYLIEARVYVSTSQRDADVLAKQIINSPLIKTAIHGSDPNWGRVLMAIGKPIGRTALPELSLSDLKISILDTLVFNQGEVVDCDLAKLSHNMRVAKTVHIDVTIGHSSKYLGRALGCDLSDDYIRINADYTT